MFLQDEGAAQLSRRILAVSTTHNMTVECLKDTTKLLNDIFNARLPTTVKCLRNKTGM